MDGRFDDGQPTPRRRLSHNPSGEASHRKAGARAEDEACRFLEAQGYIIVHRNWRARSLEVDVIGKEGRITLLRPKQKGAGRNK